VLITVEAWSVAVHATFSSTSKSIKIKNTSFFKKSLAWSFLVSVTAKVLGLTVRYYLHQYDGCLRQNNLLPVLCIFKYTNRSEKYFISADFCFIAYYITIFLIFSLSKEIETIALSQSSDFEMQVWKNLNGNVVVDNQIQYSFTKFNCTLGICNCIT